MPILLSASATAFRVGISGAQTLGGLLVSIDSAIRRAHAYAHHHQKVWHVVEYPGGIGAPVGTGHIYEGNSNATLKEAAKARRAAQHTPAFVAMHAVFPDGSRLEVTAAGLAA